MSQFSFELFTSLGRPSAVSKLSGLSQRSQWKRVAAKLGVKYVECGKGRFEFDEFNVSPMHDMPPRISLSVRSFPHFLFFVFFFISSLSFELNFVLNILDVDIVILFVLIYPARRHL